MCCNDQNKAETHHLHDQLYPRRGEVYTRSQVDDLLAALVSGMPVVNLVGEIRTYAGTTIPTGWLECNAQILDVEDYPELYAVIGHAFDQVALVDQFQLPPPGRVLVGRVSALTEFDEVGKQGGEMYHTLLVSEMPTHRHNWVTRSGSQATGVTYTNVLGTTNRLVTGGTGGSEVVQSPLLAEVGDGEGHNNLQPYVVVTMIIRALP